MTIHKATTGDLDSIKRVKSFISDPDINERLERQARGEVDFLVLEDQGELCSFVLLKWNGKDTHPDYPDMEDLYTKESMRGKGYGTMLVTECERLAKEKDFKRIGLAVNPTENKHARDLYEHLGYSHDGKASYIDGVYNGVEDWVIDMEKLLE